ncbi:MAG: GntR family transcriptional regulator [Caulobacteraceae bacterium]
MAAAGGDVAWHRTTVRTLPEQIADDLGAAIARGDVPSGGRLLEQNLAERYGVSRGPVREALRLLSQRGLAVLYPRRGAFAVEVSLDSLVDLFNTRAVLMGLAARYFAVMAPEEARRQLGTRVANLDRVARADGADAPNFIAATSTISFLISRHCGSESLGRLIEHQNENSAWGALWRNDKIDFDTRARRDQAASDYMALDEAIQRGDGADAEAVMRHLIMRARQNAVAALARSRGETFDSRRMLAP